MITIGEVSTTFDWRDDPYTDERRHAYIRQAARLENGHVVYVWQNRIPQAPGELQDHWGWAVYIPESPGHESNPANWPACSDVSRPGRSYEPNIKTEEEAKLRAEEAYRELYPIGTDTGHYDSGVDYSDLNAFKDFL